MNIDEVLEILSNVENPVLHNFNIPPFNLEKPQLRFRGGEHGKLHSSMKNGFYMGDRTVGTTHLAYTIFDAADLFSIRRSGAVDLENRFGNAQEIGTNRKNKGGRYCSENGDEIEGYKWGFPFLIAVDIRLYINYLGSTCGKVREIVITCPIRIEDLVILFDKNVDHLCKIPSIKETELYKCLVDRRARAFEEKSFISF